MAFLPDTYWDGVRLMKTCTNKEKRPQLKSLNNPCGEKPIEDLKSDTTERKTMKYSEMGMTTMSKKKARKTIHTRRHTIQIMATIRGYIASATSGEYSKSYTTQKRSAALNYVLELRDKPNNLRRQELRDLVILCDQAMGSYVQSTGKWHTWYACRNSFSTIYEGRGIHRPSNNDSPTAHARAERGHKPYSKKYRDYSHPPKRRVKGCKSIW